MHSACLTTDIISFHFIISNGKILLRLGEMFHGERGFGVHKKKFHVRVYPAVAFERRNQEKCCAIIEELTQSSNQSINNTISQTNIKKGNSNKMKRKKISSYGHLGKYSFNAVF